MTTTKTKLSKLNKVLAQLEVAKEMVEILKGQAKDLIDELDLQGTQQLDGLAITIIEDNICIKWIESCRNISSRFIVSYACIFI